MGDAKAVAEQLLEALRARQTAGPREAGAARSPRSRRGARRACEAEQALTGDPMMPQRVFPELRKVLPRDCMVTIDAGIAPGLGYDRLDFELPRTFFNYAGHGGLGMGYAVGLGTKLGRPDRPALSLQGDGGFLYTSQEINTAVRHSIPLVSHRPQQQLPRRGEGAAAAPLRARNTSASISTIRASTSSPRSTARKATTSRGRRTSPMPSPRRSSWTGRA